MLRRIFLATSPSCAMISLSRPFMSFILCKKAISVHRSTFVVNVGDVRGYFCTNHLSLAQYFVRSNGRRGTYSLSLTSRPRMKSFASSDMLAKASWSKSYLAMVTFAIVSMSVSPINGDRPDNLEISPSRCPYYSVKHILLYHNQEKWLNIFTMTIK